MPTPSLDPGECRVIAGGREADAGCRQRLAACMDQVRGQLMPETTIDGHGSDGGSAPSRSRTAAGELDALGAAGRASMISNALRRVELGDVPVSTPTGRLVGASGLLLEASGCTLRTGQRRLIEQRLRRRERACA